MTRMDVRSDATLEQVTLRHPTWTTLLHAAAAAVLGIGSPALAQRHAPGLVVVALGVTALAALWVARRVGEVAVLDDASITLGAGRAARRRLAWPDVASLERHDGRLRITTTAGVSRAGPPCDEPTLAQLRAAAAELGLPVPSQPGQ